jgi:hypothetical protein
MIDHKSFDCRSEKRPARHCPCFTPLIIALVQGAVGLFEPLQHGGLRSSRTVEDGKEMLFNKL